MVEPAHTGRPIEARRAWRLRAVVVVMALLCGCRDPAPAPVNTANAGKTNSQDIDKLFRPTIESLRRIDELSSVERFLRSQQEVGLKVKSWLDTRDPPTAWEPDPTADVLRTVTRRLSDWIKVHAEDIEWQRDALIGTLPKALQEIPEMQRLDALRLNAVDGHYLREALWLNQISTPLVSGKTSDLDAAAALFDWVIRNVQLDGPGPLDDPQQYKPPLIMHLPWQVILYGHGTAEERAWVFACLARQQGLRVVMLAVPQSGQTGIGRPWLPALAVDGELHLFDAQLGLPIPGPEGKGVATLSQVAADDALLRRLDLSAERPYAVHAAELARVQVWIEGSPAYLSRRMAVLQSGLSAEDKMALAGKPSEWARALKGVEHVGDVKLWPLPQQTFAHAETLSVEGRREAVNEFAALTTWLPRRLRPDEELGLLWRARMLHWRIDWKEESQVARNAVFDYYSAMPSDKLIDERAPEESALLRRAKQNATYWLGLLQIGRGNPADAMQYLQRLTLDKWPDGPWTSGARYNLARVYEETGETAKAIELYEQDVSPQFHGNRLRGRWLKETQAVTQQ